VPAGWTHCGQCKQASNGRLHLLYEQADKASKYRSGACGMLGLTVAKLSLSTAFYWVQVALITSPSSPAKHVLGHAQSNNFMLDAYTGDAHFDFRAPHWTRSLEHTPQYFRISRQELTSFLRHYSKCLPNAKCIVSPAFFMQYSRPSLLTRTLASSTFSNGLTKMYVAMIIARIY
jgi:hypothetical protein